MVGSGASGNHPSLRPVRLALVGVGRWGRALLNTIPTLPGVRLSHCVSGNPETASLLPGGCLLLPTWQGLLEVSGLDGVVLAIPPEHQLALADTLGANGLAVMVEKPLSLDLEEALAFRERVRERAGIVLVDHIQLFHPAVVRLKALAPTLGALREIRSFAGQWGPFRRHPIPVLWDYGPHDASLCLELVEAPPDRILIRREERRDLAAGLGETIDWEMGYPDGVTAHIHLSNVMPGKRRYLAMRREEGTLVYDDLAPHKLTRHPPLAEPDPIDGEPIPLEEGRPLTRALAEFVDRIRRRDPALDSLDRGVQVVRLLDACQRQLDRDGPFSTGRNSRSPGQPLGC
ncbi:MAG: Gfo/Idh/MocA family oxidoreductase [Magnetococcales bacterium]|nr:Gfo/Idh/MocA family oxidoreductase [Magnetococcales bacterium]